MNKLYKFLFLSLVCTGLLFSVSSCDETIEASVQTFVPFFELLGDEITIVEVGSAWDDPGANATEGPDNLDVAVSGTVDLNTIGVYEVEYSTVATSGETFSANRVVVVVPDPADVSGASLGGKYSPLTGPVACGIVNDMTEVAKGAYFFDWYGDRSDCINGDIFAYFFSLDGETIFSPLQPIPGNIFGQSSSEGTGTFDPNTGVCDLAVTIYSAGVELNRSWQKN